MELESIGRNIRKFRLMRNLRQEDLAEMAGLSINYVGALERGEKIPSLETFIVLLNALEVSSDMVLSSLLVEKHQADASRLMDRMQNLPAYDIERILAVVDCAYTVFKYGSRVSYCFFSELVLLRVGTSGWLIMTLSLVHLKSRLSPWREESAFLRLIFQ